jgi:hypothetical protein
VSLKKKKKSLQQSLIEDKRRNICDESGVEIMDIVNDKEDPHELVNLRTYFKMNPDLSVNDDESR